MQQIKAISLRTIELANERNWTDYKLSMESAVPTSTISNIMLCKCKSCAVSTIVNFCRGFNIPLDQFFTSELFDLENLDDD